LSAQQLSGVVSKPFLKINKGQKSGLKMMPTNHCACFYALALKKGASTQPTK
jgi:hypothetical protein